MARLFIILFTLAIISQVITDKGSSLILQEEPKAKDILELDEDITEFNNTQNTNDSEKSSVDSNADSSESNAKSNTNLSNESSAKSSKNSNKDSQTQKEILEMYFSYGKEMIKLEGDDSRHSNDMNLHIVTSGYENGEEVKVMLESSDNQKFVVCGKIQNNEVIIKNVVKDR